MTQLTKNFSLNELTKSNDAARHGIDNTPTGEVAQNLKVLAEKILQPVRDHFGMVTVSSGFRCKALNEKIGGAVASDHMTGHAADFEVMGVENRVLAEWIKANLKFTQLILEFPGQNPNDGWIHCSYNPANLKNQCLTAIKQNGKTVYLNGLN